MFVEFIFYGRRLKRNSEMALAEMGDNEKRLGNTERIPIN